jgi:5'-methylthioadenosine phosphorylase
MLNVIIPFKPAEIAEIGIIGGSGFYDLATDLKEIKVETPFGPPSDKLAVGVIANRSVAFLPRHGKSHHIPPHQIPYRANIWALYSLGIKQIITAHAVGSLQKKIRPGDLVVLDQFVDRTCGRKDTFFDGALATHISSAFPYCKELRNHSIKTAKKLKIKVHSNGTAVVIQGPRFSTAAESLWFTKMGWDVVNMTEYPEVVLARELQMCYCGLAFATDYNAGVVLSQKIDPVSAKEVGKVFKENVDRAKKVMVHMVESWPERIFCGCQKSLDDARL